MPIWAATSDVLISSFPNLLNEESEQKRESFSILKHIFSSLPYKCSILGILFSAGLRLIFIYNPITVPAIAPNKK